MTEDDLTPRQKGFIEGYAAACDNVLHFVTGDCGSSKSYDPMTIEGNVMHSYAFNLKDGGRHHPLNDYKSVDEICGFLIAETIETLSGDGVKVFAKPDLKL